MDIKIILFVIAITVTIIGPILIYKLCEWIDNRDKVLIKANSCKLRKDRLPIKNKKIKIWVKKSNRFATLIDKYSFSNKLYYVIQYSDGNTDDLRAHEFEVVSISKL